MLPIVETYWHDHVQAPRPRTPSFLDSPTSTSTPTCVSLSSLVQQLNDHQALNEISFLIILSMCEGNHLLDLTRDSHTQQNRATGTTLKMWLGFCLCTRRIRFETLILNVLKLSWKFCKKNNLHDFQSIESNSRSIEPVRIAHSILQLTRFQLYIKASINKTKNLFWSWFANNTN